MGEHEYYCASYSSKEQPHVEGLLLTLADGIRAKERDIVEAKATGEEIASHEVCRKLLHSLISSTNRRMHKGFPEMLTYLLRKPMEYCSHQFVSFGCDQSVQDFVDKGSSRTLTQTAKIKGLIGMKDSNGVDALKVLQSLMWKETEGNNFNNSLAVDDDVFLKWRSTEPNTVPDADRKSVWFVCSEMVIQCHASFNCISWKLHEC